MSSISSNPSPLQLLQSQLQSSVSNGTIKSSDQDALSGALTDIDASVTSSRTDGSSAPTDLKSKIDDLISNEVSNGKLTSDQATELKSVFANAFGKGGPGGPGGAGGPGGPGSPGGPRGAGGGNDIASLLSTDDSDDSDSDTDDTSVTGAADVLKQFLSALQASQESQSAIGYGASGSTTTASSSLSALLVNYTT